MFFFFFILYKIYFFWNLYKAMVKIVSLFILCSTYFASFDHLYNEKHDIHNALLFDTYLSYNIIIKFSISIIMNLRFPPYVL